jgi:hypothetical protein
MALEKLMVLYCVSYVKVLDDPSSCCRVLDDPWQWWAHRMLVSKNRCVMEGIKNGFWKSYALFLVIRACSFVNTMD